LLAGDATGHLLWRLQNGETLRWWAPRAVVLMIGLNDLTAVMVNDSKYEEQNDIANLTDHVFNR
jgi:hypothetical protein